jgi:hypothetical protein
MRSLGDTEQFKTKTQEKYLKIYKLNERSFEVDSRKKVKKKMRRKHVQKVKWKKILS